MTGTQGHGVGHRDVGQDTGTQGELLCLLETKRGRDGKCNDKANLSLDLPGASQLCLSHPRLPPSLPLCTTGLSPCKKQLLGLAVQASGEEQSLGKQGCGPEC